MEAARHLHAVPTPIEGFNGEVTPQNFRLLLARVRELEAHEERLERELKGKRLQIAKLEADREAEAMASPERPQVECLHKLWKKACRRRRALHFTDRENMARAVKRLGFDTCCRAIAGAAYDPYTRRLKNGRLERYDDLELIFRNFGKVTEFARRAPQGWKPNPDKIAAITGVPLADVREWLGVES